MEFFSFLFEELQGIFYPGGPQFKTKTGGSIRKKNHSRKIKSPLFHETLLANCRALQRVRLSVGTVFSGVEGKVVHPLRVVMEKTGPKFQRTVMGSRPVTLSWINCEKVGFIREIQTSKSECV